MELLITPLQNGAVDNTDSTTLLSVAQIPDDIGKLKKQYRNIPLFKVLLSNVQYIDISL